MSYEVWCHTLVAQVAIEVVDLAPPLVSRTSHPMDEENQRLLNFRESPRGSLLGTALKLLPEKVEEYVLHLLLFWFWKVLALRQSHSYINIDQNEGSLENRRNLLIS